MKSELITIAEFKEILENCSPDIMFRVYHKDKGKPNKAMKKAKKNYTLNQIGDALFKFIDTTNKRFDNLETRMDRLETRLDHVEKRLDYNGLKDLPVK